MFDDFERVSVNKTRSNSKLTVEPSIAIGSGGIVYALYKYLILLKKQSRVSGNYWRADLTKKVLIKAIKCKTLLIEEFDDDLNYKEPKRLERQRAALIERSNIIETEGAMLSSKYTFNYYFYVKNGLSGAIPMLTEATKHFTLLAN